MSDEEAMDLLDDLNTIARETDSYDFGLPLYGEPLKQMIQLIKTKFNEQSKG